ncbi:MBL fold metallo-hydrolase [Bacteroidales bacterium OttesenSCG-928-M06]|nr:MBL fold metallo-hydrolase [Bacteroidales bacterium OttesenSCG-928-M06]
MNIKRFEFNPVRVNTYLIYDETREAVILDCGASTDQEFAYLVEYIRTHQLKLKYLLNTHLHFDHVLGNHYIYEEYGLKPQYNKVEESMPGLRAQSSAFGLGLNYEPISAEHFLQEGDTIHFGNTELKALFTPGHSPGSLSFYCEKEHCVFTGDVLFHRSVGRTDLWGGDTQTLKDSIRKKLFVLPENTVVYPGHGPETSIGEEKKENPFL